MIHKDTSSQRLAFTVQVPLRSVNVSIVGSHQGALKAKLTAPPVGGAANKQGIQVPAIALGLPKSVLTIVCEKSSRSKQLPLRSHALDSKAGAMEALWKKIWELGCKSV